MLGNTINLAPFILVVVVLAAAGLVIRAQQKQKQQRRSRLLEQCFSDTIRAEIAEDFHLYAKLPEKLRDELDGLIHVFLSEKEFVPCGGLDAVSPHMQRVIAAQACLLLLRSPHHFYAKLRSILVYPDAYHAPGADGAVDTRLGESWSNGSVVLSWSSVVGGGRNEHDGHAVVIHEFAHQLDQADGAGDGVPYLESRGAYQAWANAFQPAFERFSQIAAAGKANVIDDYGAENPAEFFAVVTETFYEKPKQLQKKYPKVYQQLKQYYGVDPLEW
ncbi:zinc-dependent peptidase [Rubritalea marina]|uniref:M90 family metallopeptidase n=1 Tax=Rubritalea marina TaxID=361055 RepID=UPI00036E80DC|nr:M90 family metallopeptidase [Rubritalea marina]